MSEAAITECYHSGKPISSPGATLMSEDGSSVTQSVAPARPGLSIVVLLPIMSSVFVAFLVTGIAMPVVPLHVHDGLGLNTFTVGPRAPQRTLRGGASRMGRCLFNIANDGSSNRGASVSEGTRNVSA